MMNFDWYGSTVEADWESTMGYLGNALPGASPERARPLMGYGQAVEFKQAGGVVAKLMWENRGARDEDTCYVVGTGPNAPVVATALRRWQEQDGVFHRVSRVDVAEDFAGEGMWERLSGESLAVADAHRIKVEHAGDWHRGLDGRTLYVGGRQSPLRAVCYEKGKQLKALYPEADPLHVRVELRVRPDGRTAKYQAGQMPPVDLYGASPWTRDLAARIGHPDVARCSLGSVYRVEDKQRSRRALLRMFGNTLVGLRDDEGTWSAVGEWIGKELGS